MIQDIIKGINRISTIIYSRYNKIKFYTYGNQLSICRNATIKGPVYIRLRKTGKLIIGNNFYCVSGCCYNPIARNIRTSFCTEENAVIEIGDNVGISSSSIRAFERITIGNNVNIIIDSDAHSLNYEDRRDGTLDKQNRKSRPIVIEDDVLIGTRSIILKGVTVSLEQVLL